VSLLELEGVVAGYRGSQVLHGIDLEPDQVARLGLAHVPQGRGTLARLTAADNLMVGRLRQALRAAPDT
jgi:branched-chain amino acid transport system ATP-binding protein